MHPKDVQDGKVQIMPSDITTNVPYSPNAHMAFDQEPAKAQLKKCATVHGNLVEIDLRHEETIYATTDSSSMRSSPRRTSRCT